MNESQSPQVTSEEIVDIIDGYKAGVAGEPMGIVSAAFDCGWTHGNFERASTGRQPGALTDEQIDKIAESSVFWEDADSEASLRNFARAIERALASTEAPAESDAHTAVLAAVFKELDEGDKGNGPGHGHTIPGIWDSDNGARAGKPCTWCATWAKFRALVKP